MIQPLSDLERFEIVQAMFPSKLNDEEHDIGDEEEILWDEFSIYPEFFDYLVGHLVMLAPALQSPLTGNVAHCLGRAKGSAFIAVVQRDSLEQSGAEEEREAGL